MLGLDSNLFCLLQIIPDLVGMAHRGNSCECENDSKLILINICICNELCYNICGQCNISSAREHIFKVIRWFLV